MSAFFQKVAAQQADRCGAAERRTLFQSWGAVNRLQRYSRQATASSPVTQVQAQFNGQRSFWQFHELRIVAGLPVISSRHLARRNNEIHAKTVQYGLGKS